MEQLNSFNGFSGLDSRSIRGFHNASGCGSYNASGRTLSGVAPVGGSTAGKQTSSGCIKQSCGSKHPNNYNCYDADTGENNGCGCSDKRSGRCMKGGGGARIYTDAEIMDDIRKSGRKAPRTLAPINRKSRRASKDRISVAPVGGVGRQTAGGADCGQPCGQRGLGVVRRCRKKGCKCDDINSTQGTCVPVKSRLGSAQAPARKMNFSHHSNFSAPARRFSPAERVFPYGTGNYFSGGSARGCELDRR